MSHLLFAIFVLVDRSFAGEGSRWECSGDPQHLSGETPG